MCYNNEAGKTAVDNCLGVAQFGSVLEWGSRGRKFDSCHPDQKKGERCVHLFPFFYSRTYCSL